MNLQEGRGTTGARLRKPHGREGPRTLRLFLILAVSVVLIGGSASWIIHSLGGQNTGTEKPPIYLYCTECRDVYEPQERLGGEHPRLCDKCGKRAAWFAQQCADCGEVFPGVSGVCPNCGSANWRMYDSKTDSGSNKER